MAYKFLPDPDSGDFENAARPLGFWTRNLLDKTLISRSSDESRSGTHSMRLETLVNQTSFTHNIFISQMPLVNYSERPVNIGFWAFTSHPDISGEVGKVLFMTDQRRPSVELV